MKDFIKDEDEEAADKTDPDEDSFDQPAKDDTPYF
jgi:hypothetical protein